MPRSFATTIITEVELVDGDDADQFDQTYLDHLNQALTAAARLVSTRFIKEEVRVTFCAGGPMRHVPARNATE